MAQLAPVLELLQEEGAQEEVEGSRDLIEASKSHAAVVAAVKWMVASQ